MPVAPPVTSARLRRSMAVSRACSVRGPTYANDGAAANPLSSPGISLGDTHAETDMDYRTSGDVCVVAGGASRACGRCERHPSAAAYARLAPRYADEPRAYGLEHDGRAHGQGRFLAGRLPAHAEGRARWRVLRHLHGSGAPHA